jgi:phenylacetate-CoA ligase
MRVGYHRRRMAGFVAGMRLAREFGEAERWPRERLRRHQQERLETVARHAVRYSPFYREWLAGLVGDGPVSLESLPLLHKAGMMENFDDLVTDRRLRREELLERVEESGRDEYYLGSYRVMTTSGSSGRKGLFVYDQSGWSTILAQFLRHCARMEFRPRLPRQRVAAIVGGAPTHMSRQVASSVSVGIHNVRTLPGTLPVERLVEELNYFGPDHMNAFPSLAAILADEQLAGRLRISLKSMTTSSELRTPEMTDRIVEAFEDAALVENVDEDGRPVPPGEPGERLLITGLYNMVQPVIRLEVSDVVALESGPCPCGRTLVRARHRGPARQDAGASWSERRRGCGPPLAVRPPDPRPRGTRVPGGPGGRERAHPGCTAPLRE